MGNLRVMVRKPNVAPNKQWAQVPTYPIPQLAQGTHLQRNVMVSYLHKLSQKNRPLPEV